MVSTVNVTKSPGFCGFSTQNFIFFLQCYVQLSEIKYFMSQHYISRTNSKILTPSISHWLKLIIVKVDHDSTGIYIHGRFNMIILNKS